MKYRVIYEALERRWRVSPGFRFADFSEWRRKNATYRPLWIVVDDKLSGQRIWLTQIGRDLTITYQKMNEKGVCHGESMSIRCKDQKHMAQEFDALFAKANKAA